MLFFNFFDLSLFFSVFFTSLKTAFQVFHATKSSHTADVYTRSFSSAFKIKEFLFFPFKR
jgi:hypothetical protein